MRQLCAVVSLLLPLLLSACSPFYVIRAGWQEAKLLAGREPIEGLLKDEETPVELKNKFQLVLAARTFAESLGLKPNGSFTEYSDVGRDVLIWVLSGSSQTSFTPVTWWFPIVGRVPYKGFFEKEDAVEAARELKADGLDIFLRPSPAFSTLGWFDDPLLSTVVKFDEVSLVDTVVHEILHNTVWVQDNADFNESLANFVGVRGAREFFHQRPDGASLAEQAEARFHDELLFADFLKQVRTQLDVVYKDSSELADLEDDEERERIEAEIVARRELVFSEARSRWVSVRELFRSEGYRKKNLEINNAMIIANQVYLTKLEVFEKLFKSCGEELPKFVAKIKEFAAALSSADNPFDAVARENCTESIPSEQVPETKK